MTTTAQNFYGACTPNEHKSTITNYCANMDCLKELCPECIQEHYQYHVTSKTPAAIQSITSTRVNCERKIAAAILNLQKEVDQFDVSYIFNPDEVLNQEINKMEEIKQQMIRIIELFFQEQEQKLAMKVQENSLKVQNIGGIFQRVQEVINQLDNLRTNLLTNQDPFPFFNKTCRLDVKSLTDRYKSELKKIIQNRQLDPINVHIDEHRLFNLKNELNKIVQVIVHGNKNEEEEEDDNLEEEDDDHKSHSYHQPLHHPQPTSNPPPPEQEPSVHKSINKSHNQIESGESRFSIIMEDYFKGSTKFLHFFVHNEKKLVIYPINASTIKQQVFDIQCDFPIPTFHKSIAIPSGEIYVIGGKLDDNQRDGMIRQLKGNKLINVAAICKPRSSHSITYCNGAIYIMNGFLEAGQSTKCVEKFTISSQKLEQCANNIFYGNSPAVCSFNDRYIYKFGGLDEQLRNLLVIERFDTFINRWECVDATADSEDVKQSNLQFYQSAACAQINQNTIFVFGGYDHNDIGTTFSFLLQINGANHHITGINKKTLITAEGFWQNQCIINDRKLYALQNLDDGTGNQAVDKNRRNPIIFDGHDWNSQFI